MNANFEFAYQVEEFVNTEDELREQQIGLSVVFDGEGSGVVAEQERREDCREIFGRHEVGCSVEMNDVKQREQRAEKVAVDLRDVLQAQLDVLVKVGGIRRLVDLEHLLPDLFADERIWQLAQEVEQQEATLEDGLWVLVLQLGCLSLHEVVVAAFDRFDDLLGW